VTREINLYNPALAPKVEIFSGRAVVGALAAVLGLSLAAWVGIGIQAARAAQRENAQAAQLAQLQAEVTRLAQQSAMRRPDPAVQDELARSETLLAERNQVLATLDSGALGDTAGVSEYFRAFARQTVNGVWLTGFRVAGAGSDIVIQGRTLDAALVPGFLARLREEDVLRGHSFESLTVYQPGAAGAESKPAGYLEFRMATSLRDQQGGPRETAKSGAAR
jgi:cell division protein FtsB